jgi:hypothetical protein
MKQRSLILLTFLALAGLLILPDQVAAQRMKHARPSTGGRTTSARPQPSTGGRINGGATRSSSRYQNVDRSKVNTREMPKSRPSTTDTRDRSQAKSKAQNVDRDQARTKVENTRVDKNTNIGNKVDINTGDKNVNINVDNSKDINIDRRTNINRSTNVVRRSPYRYSRPPYSYGGFHFYCHFGYSYHPYRPYYYGPTWHPWGFFIGALTATAIVVSINNAKYHYDQGVFYEESQGGYTAVEAPNGAVVPDIPDNAQQVVIEQNVTNNYYYGGTYYEKGSEGYTVVAPQAGSLVEGLPEGAEEVKIGEVTYVQYGDTYYQPVKVDGKEMYEVVHIEEAG